MRGILLTGICALLVGTVGATARSEPAVETEALLQELKRAYLAAETLTADVELLRRDGKTETRLRGSVSLKKPNLVRVELTGPFGRKIVSDGRSLWTWLSEGNTYRKAEVRPFFAENFGVLWAKPISLFFNPDNLVLNPLVRRENTQSRLVGTEQKGAVLYRILEVTTSGVCAEKIRHFIAPDGLVRRTEAELTSQGESIHLEAVFTNLRVGVPLSEENFTFAPGTAAPDDPGKRGLVGSRASDFTLPLVSTGRIALQDVRAKNRAVLLSFWFYR